MFNWAQAIFLERHFWEMLVVRWLLAFNRFPQRSFCKVKLVPKPGIQKRQIVPRLLCRKISKPNFHFVAQETRKQKFGCYVEIIFSAALKRAFTIELEFFKVPQNLAFNAEPQAFNIEPGPSPSFKSLGSGLAEHTPRDREVEGSNPAGCWACSPLYLISSVSLIRSLMGVQH